MILDKIIKDLEPKHDVPEPGVGAQELFGQITATEQASKRRGARTRLARKWQFAAPVVAGLAAAFLALGLVFPGVIGLGPEQATALDIKREGDFFIITVKDTFADPKRYEKQLRDQGLDIRLTMAPVSPGLQGTLFGAWDSRQNGLSEKQISRRKDLIQSISRPGCSVGSCTIGLKVPVNYKPDPEAVRLNLRTEIMLGREARLGERYRAFGQLNNAGEPLQCQEFVNKTLDQVKAMLGNRGVIVANIMIPKKGSRLDAPSSWYVHEGWLTEPGKALLVADKTKNMTPFPKSRQCPKRS